MNKYRFKSINNITVDLYYIKDAIKINIKLNYMLYCMH